MNKSKKTPKSLSVKIRLMTREDIESSSTIVGENYSEKWKKMSSLEMADMFGDSAIRPIYYVAVKGEEVVGFAGFIMSWMDYNIYQIFWVNVSPKYQGQGIGKKLVGKVVSEIKKKKSVHLILLTADNKNSIYYEKNFGFKPLQKFMRTDYNLMSLDLKN